MALPGNESTVLRYLDGQNKPFNCQLLADSLQTQGIKKTQVQSALDALVGKELIVTKLYGKQSIYFPRQDKFESLEKEQLAALEVGNEDLRQEIAGVSSDLGEAEGEVAKLGKSLTDAELEARISELKEENAALDTKLAALKGGAGKLVTAAERKGVEEKAGKALGEWKKRKRVFKEIMETLCEATEKRPKVFMEDTGVETDEDAGVSVEAITALLQQPKPGRSSGASTTTRV